MTDQRGTNSNAQDYAAQSWAMTSAWASTVLMALADAEPCDTLPAVCLLTDMDAFYLDHRRCGELDAGVDGVVIRFDCECGARIADRPAC